MPLRGRESCAVMGTGCSRKIYKGKLILSFSFFHFDSFVVTCVSNKKIETKTINL